MEFKELKTKLEEIHNLYEVSEAERFLVYEIVNFTLDKGWSPELSRKIITTAAAVIGVAADEIASRKGGKAG